MVAWLEWVNDVRFLLAHQTLSLNMQFIHETLEQINELNNICSFFIHIGGFVSFCTSNVGA